MKKIFILILGILLLAGIVSASLFYFGKKSKVADSNQTTSASDFVIAISPHHLVAEKMIEKIFSQIADPEVEDVVIISPNHFNQGRDNIQSSLYLKGGIKTDQNWIKDGQQKGFFSVEDASFQNEHGINNLVPYVLENFPKAKIIPIIISEKTSDQQIDKLVTALDGLSNKKTRIILSADFSHYLTNPAAQSHNLYAQKVLYNLDLENTSKVDIDCQKGLQVIMKIAKDQGFSFQMLESSNAAIIGNSDFAAEPTSYITGTYAAQNLAKKMTNISLSLFGNPEQYVSGASDSQGMNFILSDVERLFWGADANVADLDNLNVGETLLAGFKKRNFIQDFGKAEFSGQENGITYALIKYDDSEQDSEKKVVSALAESKEKEGLKIVYADWNQEVGRDEERKLAHEFIDTGADLVIGNSDPGTELIEKYGGELIFYSMGGYSRDKAGDMISLAVGMNYDQESGKSSYYLMPMKVGTGQKDEMLQGDELKNFLDKLAASSSISTDGKDQIRHGIMVDE